MRQSWKVSQHQVALHGPKRLASGWFHCVEPTNPSRSAATRSGRSQLGEWPVSGYTVNCAPGIAAARRCCPSTPANSASCSPHRINVGAVIRSSWPASSNASRPSSALYRRCAPLVSAHDPREELLDGDVESACLEPRTNSSGSVRRPHALLLDLQRHAIERGDDEPDERQPRMPGIRPDLSPAGR